MVHHSPGQADARAPADRDHRIDREAFEAWAERQMEQSRSPTSRIIKADDEGVRYRLREEGVPEDIVLLHGREVDTLRFEKGDDVRQFHAHRREFTFHGKTLIVRQPDGAEICRAGTGTRKRRGPFPL